MIKLSKLEVNFTSTKVSDEAFDKIVSKLKGKDITHLVLHFGKTRIRKDLGIVNLAPVLQKMQNLELLTIDFYSTRVTDMSLYRIS